MFGQMRPHFSDPVVGGHGCGGDRLMGDDHDQAAGRGGACFRFVRIRLRQPWRISIKRSLASARRAVRMVGRLAWNISHKRRSPGKKSFQVPVLMPFRITSAICPEGIHVSVSRA